MNYIWLQENSFRRQGRQSADKKEDREDGMNDTIYGNYLEILREELVPALGCTEPIALAFAAAKAREVLGEFPEQMAVHCSGNIIKNVIEDKTELLDLQERVSLTEKNKEFVRSLLTSLAFSAETESFHQNGIYAFCIGNLVIALL